MKKTTMKGLSFHLLLVVLHCVFSKNFRVLSKGNLGGFDNLLDEVTFTFRRFLTKFRQTLGEHPCVLYARYIVIY